MGNANRHSVRHAGSCEPPELLPPVSSEPPMCLEDIVASCQWQRRRGVPHSFSEPCLPVKNAEGCRGSRRSAFPLRRPPGTAEAEKGRKIAGGPMPPPRSPFNVEKARAQDRVQAAREILSHRGRSKEVRHKSSSTFTDGRRQAALMRCIESLEAEKVEPTLGEISKRLMQEGWEMKEVQEHLMLLADDTDKWNVRSGRELGEQRLKPEYSHLPAILEARG